MGVSEALEKVGELLLVMTQEREHTKESAQARFFVASHKIKCTIISHNDILNPSALSFVA